MDDLGPGDVVEATHNVYRTEGVHAALVAVPGDRAVVVGIINRNSHQVCGFCQTSPPIALLLDEPYPGIGRGWCPCGWRKIGGSREDTVRQFANDLDTEHPSVRRWKVDA